MFALFINAAILIVSAATFYTRGRNDVAEIQDAYKLLSPMLGVTGASTLFALALLASGQNSTLTGTLAGQIVMEGFLNIRLRPWLRRLITRGIAIIPAVIVTSISGEKGTTELLVLSQVILSLQLSFAVFPLVMFTSDKLKMGEFVNGFVIKCLAWFDRGRDCLAECLASGANLSRLVSHLRYTYVQDNPRSGGKRRDRSNDPASTSVRWRVCTDRSCCSCTWPMAGRREILSNSSCRRARR